MLNNFIPLAFFAAHHGKLWMAQALGSGPLQGDEARTEAAPRPSPGVQRTCRLGLWPRRPANT